MTNDRRFPDEGRQPSPTAVPSRRSAANTADPNIDAAIARPTGTGTTTSTGSFSAGAPVSDLSARLRRIIARVQGLEKEAAVLAAELVDIDDAVRTIEAAPATVPLLAYKAQQAGEAMGVGRSTVYKLMNSGELPFIQHGDGYRRVLASDVVAYLESLRVRKVAEPHATDRSSSDLDASATSGERS